MDFTIVDIKNFLNELGFEWVDAMIYDSLENYRTATRKTFQGRPVSLYLRNTKTKRCTPVPTTIKEDTFIIKHGGCKLDVSEDWVDFLKGTNTQTIK